MPVFVATNTIIWSRSAVQGSTDTMFYVLAVYFGSVGVRKTRYAVPYALLADITGSVAGIIAAYIFFG